METENFVTSLESFLEGSISLQGLLEEIERITDDGTQNTAALLKILDDVHKKASLSPETYSRIKQKIEHTQKGATTQESAAADFFASDASPDDSALEDRSTKLATVYVPPKSAPSLSAETAEATALAEVLGMPQHTGGHQIKGTGDVLNERFELKECLGTGGMSTVYKALDRRKLEANDRDPYVAVKVLNQDFRVHPDSLIALQREAKKSLNLAHRNIVRVYDFDRDGDTVYMTMENLSGESLARKITKPGFKGMSADETLRIVSSMGKALAFAHESGIVHADFKPANVFITDRNEIKVIDFGIARAFHRADEASSVELTRFDPGSLGALTPSYASPEMLEQREPDPRDDIFALACTTYEMLTGEHPFKRLQANIARDSKLEAKKPQKLNRKQWKALQEALRFEREKRTPTVNRFLEQFCPPKVKSKSFGLMGGALAALLLFGVGGWYYVFHLGQNPLDHIEIARQKMQISIPDLGFETKRNDNAESNTQVSTIIPEDGAPPDTAPIKMPQALEQAEVSLETITPLLERLSCAALHATLTDGVVDVHGFAKQSDITRLERELRALEGAKSVNVEVFPTDRINCQVIDLVSPYWESNRSAALGASIRTYEASARFKAGEYLVLEIKSPSYDSYLNIDYYSHDGAVVHMLPSPRSPYNQAPSNYSATLGDLGEWRVGAPFGQEMIVLLATPKPLFTEQRKEYETQGEYLPELKQRLKELETTGGSGKITADIVLITTSP